MASITRYDNGHKMIQFVAPNGKRQSIRLGKVTMQQATALKVKVEDLAAALRTGHVPSDETSRWVAGLDDVMLSKLIDVGLIKAPKGLSLNQWLERYLADREGELKPKSHKKLQDTRDKLLAYFADNPTLRSLTEEQAMAWQRWLRDDAGLSEASTKIHCGNAKQMMREAVRRKLVPENAFERLKSGATPSRYVTPEEIDRVIKACPDAEWRLLFGLARYGGLRVPSEYRVAHMGRRGLAAWSADGAVTQDRAPRRA